MGLCSRCKRSPVFFESQIEQNLNPATNREQFIVETTSLNAPNDCVPFFYPVPVSPSVWARYLQFRFSIQIWKNDIKYFLSFVENRHFRNIVPFSNSIVETRRNGRKNRDNIFKFPINKNSKTRKMAEWLTLIVFAFSRSRFCEIAVTAFMFHLL